MDSDGKIDVTDLSIILDEVLEKEESVKTIQGDSNGDGVVDETDHKNIEDYLFGKESDEDFIILLATVTQALM